MIPNITGVVLAGGAGKRFQGITKAKLVVEGQTIISRILDVFSDIFDETIIVTNTPDEFTGSSNKCIITGDIFHNKGPLGGIHAALIKSSNESAFIFAGDMPFPDKKIILNQIRFFYSHNCECVIPSLGNYFEPLHGIYKKSVCGLLDEILRLEKNFSIQEFLKKIDTCYFQVDESVYSRKAFTNVNSPSDLRSLNQNPES